MGLAESISDGAPSAADAPAEAVVAKLAAEAALHAPSKSK
jgi:hypothetical protein